MSKSEFVLWDFEMKTDYQNLAKKQDLRIKEENFLYCGLCRPSRPQNEKQILRPCQRTETAEQHEGDGDTNCNWGICKVPKSLQRGLEELEIGQLIETIKLQHCWSRPKYWEEY